jgi:flagellar capping protein FliD
MNRKPAHFGIIFLIVIALSLSVVAAKKSKLQKQQDSLDQRIQTVKSQEVEREECWCASPH